MGRSGPDVDEDIGVQVNKHRQSSSGQETSAGNGEASMTELEHRTSVILDATATDSTRSLEKGQNAEGTKADMSETSPGAFAMRLAQEPLRLPPSEQSTSGDAPPSSCPRPSNQPSSQTTTTVASSRNDISTLTPIPDTTAPSRRHYDDDMVVATAVVQHDNGKVPWGILMRDSRVIAFIVFVLLVVVGLLVGIVVLALGGDSSADTSPTPTRSTGTSAPTDMPVVLSVPTVSPTMTQTTAAPTFQLQVVVDKLVAIKPDAITGLDDTSSPQSQALNWLLADPNVLSYEPLRLAQRFALATFHFAVLQDAGQGNNETPNLPFADFDEAYGKNECLWDNADLPEDGTVRCDGNEVVLFALPSRQIKATLPPELALLTKLTAAWFWDNNFYGTIPSVYSQFKALRGFFLSGNNYGGPMMPQLLPVFQIQSLQRFSMSWNDFTGSLPTEIGLMRELDSFEFNNVEGMTGTIPQELFDECRKLTSLDLSSGKYEGTLSTRVGQLTDLRDLSLSFNTFEGSLPSELGLLSDLAILDLYGNEFTGKIPSELGLLESLGLLDLSRNSLTGQIPPDLFLRTTKLSNWIALAENRLNGTLPTQLGRLVELGFSLEMHENQLTGPIPTELGRLTLLSDSLTLDRNQLMGPIPSELGRLERLEKLSLEYNPGVNGTIPTEFGRLTSLKNDLTFANVGITPGSAVPVEICALTNLTNVNISVNCNVDCDCCTISCF